MTTIGTHVRSSVAAALCLGVAAVHVQDQGGLTGFADPDWLGWAYRLLELGALAVALTLVLATARGWTGARSRLLWATTALVGLGPLIGYVLTRTTGLPGATDDIGEWGEPVGVASLVIEGLLVALALATLTGMRSRAGRTATRTPVTV